MGQWSERAKSVIEQVDLSLPTFLAFADRKAAIEAAYPFETRAGSPYRAWLRARREYFARFGGCDPQTLLRSPLWLAAEKRNR